jgi:hypothetical protein
MHVFDDTLYLHFCKLQASQRSLMVMAIKWRWKWLRMGNHWQMMATYVNDK